ncbi:protein N-terminal asparagine amidohydrolase-like [Oppia nitens]|uniref:protein N-terminal asparagine amidohydrolase-like n=1 Tax=Oppia nitens TaxID=1686743 RepID=UPI0023DBAD2B|nr:protein N-terminal asparagine amidohydrolase-like [Oppia nitens]
MPLLINGVIITDVPNDINSLFNNYPQLEESSLRLVSLDPKVVSPVALVYVCQREYAIVSPHDKSISIVGTDDTTTCCMAVLRHSTSGVTSLAHFDGSAPQSTNKYIENMIKRMEEMNISVGISDGRFELHLIGGFNDSRHYSEDLVLKLLCAYHRQTINIELVTACVCKLNNTIRNNINWPVIYGIAVNVKTGDIFPATFTDKGPDIPLRSARYYTGCHEMLDIYDSNMSLLRIGPFNYSPMRGVDLWLQQSDEFILQHLSTSPEVEPPNFVMSARTTLKFIQKNPFPGVTIFADNRPRYYRKDDLTGQWLPICY